MNKEQIEKYIKLGLKKKLTATALSQLLTQPPHNFSVVEASEVYYEFKRRYPVTVSDVLAAHTERLKKALPKIIEERHKALVEMMKPGKFPKNASNVFRDSGTVSGAPAAPAGYSPSILNRSAVKDYALTVSREKRAGKFTRVSSSFVKAIEAEVECEIRHLGRQIVGPDANLIPGEGVDFLNRKQILPRVLEQLNSAVRQIILRKVRGYPSKGQTLK